MNPEYGPKNFEPNRDGVSQHWIFYWYFLSVEKGRTLTATEPRWCGLTWCRASPNWRTLWVPMPSRWKWNLGSLLLGRWCPNNISTLKKWVEIEMVYFPGRGCWFLKMPSQSAGTELSGFEDSDTFYLVLMETNLPTPIWQGPTVNLPEGFNFFQPTKDMYSKMFKDSTVPRLHLAWLSCCSPHVFTDRSIIDLSIQGFGASVQSRWQQLPPVPAGELQGQGLNATDDPWTKHFFCVKHGDFPQKNGVLDIVVWKMFSPEMLGRWSRNPYQSPSAMCFLF